MLGKGEPKAGPGRGKKPSPASEGFIGKDDRHKFRLLAEHKKLVAKLIDGGRTRREHLPPGLYGDRKGALGKALEKIVREAAKERQQIRKGNQRGDKSENFTELSDKGDTRDKIGKAIGMSGPTYQRAKAIIRDDPEALAAWREAMKEQGKRNDLVDNVNEVTADKGNSRSYTVSRLQKQRPDLFERVKAGE